MLKRTFEAASVILKQNPLVHSLRLRHKLNKENVEKPPPKVATDVVNYLENSPEYAGLREQLPRYLLRKYKNPESMYLINKKTAKEIAKTLKKHLDSSPVIEVNPGLGFLTEELLQLHKNHHYLYESSSHFIPHLSKLQNHYPDRVTLKEADFFSLWKLDYQDKMQQGNRLKDFLENLATEDSERIVKIVGAMPGLSFIKHLITNIVFHNTTYQLGRPDLFIVMPGHIFDNLSDSEIQHSKQKFLPTLFQLFFDFKVLNTVPKVHFLPWTFSGVSKTQNAIDDNCFHLVNITRKRKLPCPPECLPLLWYFFKPHISSKSYRVIPVLEQWIPGCGVWLITGQDPPDTRRDTAPDENDAPLPHMTIFTQFGDLNLAQKITVFKRFISWPEFEQCQFRVTMENNLPKWMSPTEDDDKDPIVGTHIDDIEHSDTECETR